MRMAVEKIEYNNGDIYVTGVTDIEAVKGIWRHREPPMAEQIYFFELNIDQIDRREIFVIQGERPRASVHCHDGYVTFEGVCEEIDDVYVIRFAEDWIEMVSVSNDDFTIKKGDFLSFSQGVEKIGIYPY